mgnify:CR=1 FL=1
MVILQLIVITMVTLKSLDIRVIIPVIIQHLEFILLELKMIQVILQGYLALEFLIMETS